MSFSSGKNLFFCFWITLQKIWTFFFPLTEWLGVGLAHQTPTSTDWNKQQNRFFKGRSPVISLKSISRFASLYSSTEEYPLKSVFSYTCLMHDAFSYQKDMIFILLCSWWSALVNTCEEPNNIWCLCLQCAHKGKTGIDESQRCTWSCWLMAEVKHLFVPCYIHSHRSQIQTLTCLSRLSWPRHGPGHSSLPGQSVSS